MPFKITTDDWYDVIKGNGDVDDHYDDNEDDDHDDDDDDG